MRFIIFISILLSSLTSMASATIELVSDNYKVRATITANPGNPLNGSVVATTQSNGICNGTYNLDFTNNTLTIALVNSGEVGIGNCSSESMVVSINQEKYVQLLGGAEISVIFNSAMFSNPAKKALVRRLDRI